MRFVTKRNTPKFIYRHDVKAMRVSIDKSNDRNTDEENRAKLEVFNP